MIRLQIVNLELTGGTVKRTADIARKGRRVISRTDTALPAVRRGLRLTFARHISVSKSHLKLSGITNCCYITRCQPMFSL